MKRLPRPILASAGVVLLLVLGGTACGGPDEQANLTTAVEQLSSSAPDGASSGPTRFIGCGDSAEMPMASAAFEDPEAPTTDDVDALNAWLEDVTQRYLPLWAERGWRIDGGSAFKTVDGTPVRATIDAAEGGYVILAVEDGDGMCDLAG